jgi:putative oxidoreductase
MKKEKQPFNSSKSAFQGSFLTGLPLLFMQSPCPVPSLALALVGDVVCSLLLILGLATRWAALFSFLNIFAAWGLVHHFLFFGHASDHGELIALYLGSMLALFLAGPGRFSLDHLIHVRRNRT